MFTTIKEAYTYAPVEETIKFLPSWFKSIPSSYSSPDTHPLFQVPTIRNCVGLLEYFKKGAIMPLWSDVRINIGEAGNTEEDMWCFSNGHSRLESHGADQWGSNSAFLDPQTDAHLKFVTPWHFKPSKDIPIFLGKPEWVKEIRDLHIMQGIYRYGNTDSLNLNCIAKRRLAPYTIELSYGTPLAYFLPLTEQDVEYKVEHVTAAEFDKLSYRTGRTLKFKGSSRAIRKKCPYPYEDKQ